MKRSKSVKLVAMGTGLLLIAACDEAKVDTALFESIDQCTGLGFSKQECTTNYKNAQQTHIVAAHPKYTSRLDCEADFGAEKVRKRHRSGRHPGKCVYATNGWLPYG